MTHFMFCNRLQIHTEKLSVQCSNVECSGRQRGTYIHVVWIFPYRGILGYAGWKDLFCLNVLFPISDHLMVPQRTVSFKCGLMHAYPRASVCIIYEKTKGKFPGEHRVIWIGKQNIQDKKVYSLTRPDIWITSTDHRTIGRHFTTTTRILEFVVFLCKLRLLFFNPQRDWQI